MTSRQKTRRAEPHHNLYLSITSDRPDATDLDQIVDTLKTHCSSVNLRRVEEMPHALEAAFLVEFDDYKDLRRSTRSLRERDDSLKVVFIDNKEAA